MARFVAAVLTVVDRRLKVITDPRIAGDATFTLACTVASAKAELAARDREAGDA